MEWFSQLLPNSAVPNKYDDAATTQAALKYRHNAVCLSMPNLLSSGGGGQRHVLKSTVVVSGDHIGTKWHSV